MVARSIMLSLYKHVVFPFTTVNTQIGNIDGKEDNLIAHRQWRPQIMYNDLNTSLALRTECFVCE